MESGTAATCCLLNLSHDEIGLVTHELCDPLRPLLAVNLSSTAKGLRVAMEEQLVDLKQQRQQARALAARLGMGCSALALETLLRLNICSSPTRSRSGARPTGVCVLDLACWRTLGMLVGCGSLPRLQTLGVYSFFSCDEGLTLLADGLHSGRLPSLRCLCLGIEPQDATALAPALSKRALPSLEFLHMDGSPLGDAGLAALLPALRQLPGLRVLGLAKTKMGDEGMASLVAQPTEGALESLEKLSLANNHITDAGCAKLASALRGGALPALNNGFVVSQGLAILSRANVLAENPASLTAQLAVQAVLKAHRPYPSEIKQTVIDLATPTMKEWWRSGEITKDQYKEILSSVAREMARTHTGVLDANFEMCALRKLTVRKAAVLRPVTAAATNGIDSAAAAVPALDID